MTFTLTKATRKKTKIKIGLAGVSGSGKTYSALLLAKGLVGSWDKVAVIDTENGSADLYAHLGGYSTLTLEAPFTPERYIEAINTCEKAGMEVIILDSMSHEWDGKGGVLETHSALPGNSFTNWAKITPRHNNFIDCILQSPAHIICTMRSKQDYVLNERDGKQIPQKVGLKAITREGVDYEFTLVFDLDIKHNAVASKDRTELFMDKPEFKIDEKTGKTIKAWTEQGVESLPKANVATNDKNDKVEEVKPKTKPITDTLRKKFFAIANGLGYDSELVKERAKKHFKLDSFNDITKEQVEELIEKMSKDIKKDTKNAHKEEVNSIDDYNAIDAYLEGNDK